MKQIFTLVLATALSLTAAFAQTTQQNFEGIADLSSLTNSCWQFNRVDFAGAVTGNIGNSNNVLAQTTDKKNNAFITTPYVNLSVGTTISFDYKLNEALNGQAKRTIYVRLLDTSGNYTELKNIVLDKNSSISTATFTTASTLSGIQKVVIELAGSGDGNSNINLDNFSIGSNFNYNSPYGCNTTGQATLPMKLKSFQGLLSADKAILTWSVLENENGHAFQIEKSSDGTTFTTIGIVITTQKAGDEVYSYKDDLQGRAYYRLKLVSKGGVAMYSAVLFMKKQVTTTSALNLLQNPVQSTIKFSFQSGINAATQVTVYNTLGVKVYQTSFAAQKGANTIAMTLDGQIKGGTYVLEVMNATNRNSAKFLKN